MKTITGFFEKKEVSEMNNFLFNAGRKLMEASAGQGLQGWHIGWQDFGEYIDWLEQNYNIEKKSTIKLT